MKINFLNRLSFKLIAYVVIIFIIIFSIHSIFTINRLQKDLTLYYSQNAYNISDLIKRSTRYSMLHNRTEDIYQIIKNISLESDVNKIRIYNKQGEISYSTDSLELNQSVNMNDEACNICHSQKTLPSNLPWQQMTRSYSLKNNEKVLGLINPIKNEPDCYNAGCHAHSSDKKLLGVLDVIISTQKMDEIIQANINNFIINSFITIIIIAIFCGLFISLLVNRPLKKISSGIEQLSKGKLNYKIFINSKDELGIVAQQFNDMATKLDKAYQEIKNWSETLNQKVEQKNEELKRIYEQIVQVEKLASLGKLSATVAHELNNPLEGILTYSKLIAKRLEKTQNGNNFENEIKYLNLISDESARCGKIVKDLLLFSRQGEEEFKSCSLNEIIDKCIALIDHHLEINKIKLIKELPSEEIYLECNNQKIQQALIAIMINAIEAMSTSGTLSIKVKKKENNRIEIKIIDEGKGIPEKDLPYIFEPFYSTKEASKGTGLGLAVAYGIINQHNGKIFVEETSEKGTTFNITLPINQKERIV